MKKWIAMLVALVLCLGMTVMTGCEKPLEPATAEELLSVAEMNLEEGLTVNFSLNIDGISSLIPGTLIEVFEQKPSAEHQSTEEPAACFDGTVKLKELKNTVVADFSAQVRDLDGEGGSIAAYLRTTAESVKVYYALDGENEFTLFEQSLNAASEESSVYEKLLGGIFGQFDFRGSGSSELLPYCNTPEIVEREYHVSVNLGKMIQDKVNTAFSTVKFFLAMIPETATVGSLYAEETVKAMILSVLEDVSAADLKALLEEGLSAVGYTIVLPEAGDKTVSEYLEEIMKIELSTGGDAVMKFSDFPIGEYVAQLSETVVPMLDFIGTMLNSLTGSVKLAYNADRKLASASLSMSLNELSVSGLFTFDYTVPSFQNVAELTVKASASEL